MKYAVQKFRNGHSGEQVFCLFALINEFRDKNGATQYMIRKVLYGGENIFHTWRVGPYTNWGFNNDNTQRVDWYLEAGITYAGSNNFKIGNIYKLVQFQDDASALVWFLANFIYG